MKQNKKEGIILTIGIIALVIGIFTIITNFKDIFSGKPKNLNTMIVNDYNISDSSLDDKKVSVKFNSSLGQFSKDKFKYFGFFPLGNMYYYTIQLEDNSVMGIAVKKKDISTLKSISNPNLNPVIENNSNMIKFTGRIVNITNKDLKDKYEKFLTDRRIKDNPASTTKIRYIYLDTTVNNTWVRWLAFISTLVGVLILFGNSIISSVNDKSVKKRMEASGRALNIGNSTIDNINDVNPNNKVKESKTPAAPPKLYSAGENYKMMHNNDDDDLSTDKKKSEPEMTIDGKMKTSGYKLIK